MEYVIALLVVAGLGYFVYTRVKAAKAARGGTPNYPRPGNRGRNIEQ